MDWQTSPKAYVNAAPGYMASSQRYMTMLHKIHNDNDIVILTSK